MKLINKEQGFGVVGVIVSVVIVGAIGFIGWYVWQTKQNTDKNSKPLAKSSTTTTSTSPREADETPQQKIPDGWVEYAAAGVGVYYPEHWDSAKLRVDTYGQYEPISYGYGGNPISTVFEKGAAKWVSYQNYGTEHQKLSESDPDNEWGLKTINSPVSNYLVAYRKVGHAAVVTHDLYIIHDSKAYRIRLPEINTLDSPDWEALLAEQTSALPDIIANLQFAD